MARVARAAARDGRPGPLRARQLHRRAGAGAGARGRGRPAGAAEAAGDGAPVVDYDEDLPPVELEFEPIDLRELAVAVRPGACTRAAAAGSRATSSTPAPPELGGLDAGRLRALAPDPRGAVRRRARRARRLLPARDARPQDGPTLSSAACTSAGSSARASDRRAVGRDASRRSARRCAALVTRCIYGHLWGTDETRALFDDEGRTRIWLDDPRRARRGAGRARADPGGRRGARSPRACASRSTSRRWRARRARTGHSTLGLIRVLQRDLSTPGASGSTSARRCRTSPTPGPASSRSGCSRSPSATSARSRRRCARWPAEHRDTVMLGRTHGQPGLPITFGFKAAVWAGRGAPPPRAPARRRGRGSPSGQLAGAVGTLSAWGDAGPRAPAARARAARARRAGDLVDVGARPRRRAGHAAGADHRHAREDRQRDLQPPAPGDRRAAPRRRRTGVVGSITMPQKHNPERSEHLVDARARRARRRRPGARGAGRPSTSATARRGRPSGRCCPRRCGAAARRAGARRRAGRRAAGRRRADARERRRAGRLRARRAGDARARRRGRPAPRARARRRRCRSQARDAAQHVSATRSRPIPRSRRCCRSTLDALLRPERRRSARPTSSWTGCSAMTEPPEGYLGAGARDPRGPAPELVEAGYELELADAPLLARGLGLADLAHAIALDADPRRRPPRAARRAASSCSTRRSRSTRATATSSNVRERVLEQRIGSAAGWLNAGRPRREAGRIAFRIALRARVLDLAAAVTRFAAALDRGRGARARHAAARLHLPAGGAADHRRPLAAVVRLSRAARRRAPARRLRVGQPQPGRHRRRQRLALRPRPRAARRAARLQPADRAHARRQLADRRPRRPDVARRHRRHRREPLRRGRRALRQRRVRPAADRRRAVPRQRADAAEAQPVRARRPARRRRHADRPRHRRAGDPADAVGPHRQPALRLRRGGRRRRAGGAAAAPRRRRGREPDVRRASGPSARCARAARWRPTSPRRSASSAGLDYRSAYREVGARGLDAARARRARGARSRRRRSPPAPCPAAPRRSRWTRCSVSCRAEIAAARAWVQHERDAIEQAEQQLVTLARK